MITWDYATSKDIDHFYEGRPRETLRAIVIKMDGDPMAIIGLAKEPERDRAFSECKAAIQPYLTAMPVLRAIKAFMCWVQESRIPIYAMSEGTGLLERLGFRHVDGDIYEWPG